MSILQYAPAINDPTIYTDPAFMEMIKTHVPYLRAHPSTKTLTPDPNIYQMFRGDFYGLLNYVKIPSRYHYVCMVINNLSSSRNFDESLDPIYVPEQGTIDGLIAPLKNTGILSL